MLSTHCFVTKNIASKCNELERILTKLNDFFETRIDFLSNVRDVLFDIEKVGEVMC